MFMNVISMNRRRFLRHLSLAGAALTAGTLLPPVFSTLLAAAPLDQEQDTLQETRLLMGTTVTIALHAPSRTLAEDALGKAFAEMDRLIAVFDRHSQATALGTLNSQGRLDHAPAELVHVLGTAQRFGIASSHAFNPAIAPLVDLYRDATLAEATPDARDCAAALALCKPGGIRVKDGNIRLQRQGMRLTLDGIAKGYIADAASLALTKAGAVNHMINAGGDIRAQGVSPKGTPWSIGIENPSKGGAPVAVVRLSGQGIATSGGYESPYGRDGRQHHLISHRTGRSPDIASISVVAPTAMQADALATTLSLLPPAEALRFMKSRTNTACLILDGNGNRWMSPGWVENEA